jgi:hypothetical protein
MYEQSAEAAQASGTAPEEDGGEEEDVIDGEFSEV